MSDAATETDRSTTVSVETNIFADGQALLDRAANWLTWGGPALGLLRGLQLLVLGLEARASTGPILGLLDGLFTAGCWALAGVVGGALLRVLGYWLLLRAAAPTPLAQPLRIATSFPMAEAPAGGPSALENLREQEFAEVRHAIRSGHWDDARAKLEAMAEDQADAGRLEALNREWQAAREAARDEHLADLEAAQTVNDPDRVLELHQSLVPLLEDEARHDLEAELSGWFLRLIHNRLRTGRIQTELAELAARIAETFSHTVEGASLRASLPTLRRSAGLCPRCAPAVCRPGRCLPGLRRPGKGRRPAGTAGRKLLSERQSVVAGLPPRDSQSLLTALPNSTFSRG